MDNLTEQDKKVLTFLFSHRHTKISPIDIGSSHFDKLRLAKLIKNHPTDFIELTEKGYVYAYSLVKESNTSYYLVTWIQEIFNQPVEKSQKFSTLPDAVKFFIDHKNLEKTTQTHQNYSIFCCKGEHRHKVEIELSAVVKNDETDKKDDLTELLYSEFKSTSFQEKLTIEAIKRFLKSFINIGKESPDLKSFMRKLGEIERRL